MNSEVKIILEDKNEKGSFFESLMEQILSSHRYKILPNANFTGMEIDLLAKHKDKSETLYVECKARSELSSNQIKTFAFNVQFKKADVGYFFSTTEYSHQAAGLIEELNLNQNYKNLYFFGPEKIIELLTESQRLQPVSTKKLQNSTKRILALTYFGDYYIFLLSNNSQLPTNYTVLAAKDLKLQVTNSQLKKLEENIPEIKGLIFQNITNLKGFSAKNEFVPDSVVEIQESENWNDYLPASYKNFIGRTILMNELVSFISSISKKKTSKRAFYLEGKSGWGKSSILSKLRGIHRRGKYKRIFTTILDTRTAQSPNYIALALIKTLQKAMDSHFIRNRKLNITSNYDIFSSLSIKSVLDNLHKDNKYLLVVFDQFEDVFKNAELFKVFYKFILDVSSLESNIVVGFSWRTELMFSADNPSYPIWTSLKDITYKFAINEFGPSETNGIIKQLEGSLQRKVDPLLRRRLIESSQGFPWLIKKLCIHTFDEIKKGKTDRELIDEELNIEQLFKKDLENIDHKSVDALKFLAKRAYNGNIFDVTETDDIIDSKIINTLLEKRLIIKSGTKYNVYWDIFRDYLVTDEIPILGESYLIRQYPQNCLTVYQLFDKGKKYSNDEILAKHKKKISLSTLDNILRELITIGLIKRYKTEGSNLYSLSPHIDKANINTFKKHIAERFNKYRPYIELNKLNSEINLLIIERTLKNIFRGTIIKSSTWTFYSMVLASWLRFSELSISKKMSTRTYSDKNFKNVQKQQKSFKYKQNQWPYSSPKQVLEMFSFLKTNYLDIRKLSLSDVRRKKILDLKMIGLIEGSPFSTEDQYKITALGKELHKISDPSKEIASLALSHIPKLAEAYKFFLTKPEMSLKQFIGGFDKLHIGNYTQKSRDYKGKIIYYWMDYIYEKENSV